MFISNAYADPVGAATGGGDFSPILFLVVAVVMIFFMFRSQSKRAKEAKAMMEAAVKGSEVVTSGGILGKVTKVKDDYLTIEIATGVEVIVQRSAILNVLQTGTIKSI